MNLRIRPMASGEVAALGELAVLAWERVFASFRHILGPEIYPIVYPNWQQQQREGVVGVCSDHACFTVLVAEVDGAVVGFIAYELDLAELAGAVCLLAVHPDYQNRGIGTALNVRARPNAMCAARASSVRPRPCSAGLQRLLPPRPLC